MEFNLLLVWLTQTPFKRQVCPQTLCAIIFYEEKFNIGDGQMIANIETKFKCDYKTVIKKVNMSVTLDYIAFPLLKFEPINPDNYPKIWKNGKYQVYMKLFSFFPFGKQFIGIEKFKENDQEEYILRDNGTGDVIKRWDHWILIKKTNQHNLTRYIDRIDIKAGILTIFIWFFANIFYRWRQFRWKKLIKESFQQLEN